MVWSRWVETWFFAAPKQLNLLMDNLKVLASETFSTVNSPVQYAAVEAYKGTMMISN